jgi:hypothetical protein
MKEEVSARPTYRPRRATLNDAHFHGGNYGPLNSMEVYKGTASPGWSILSGLFFANVGGFP